MANQYVIPEYEAAVPGVNRIFAAFNRIIEDVAGGFGVPVADVFTAFGGFEGRAGLLLIDRHGANPFEPHPTNAGYRAMARAFQAVIP